ncbi:MAG: helix-turn-helix transcriptional regulator [Planctomycetota bacterium]
MADWNDKMSELKQQRGAVLRQARREAGLSARKLADRINARTPGSDLTDNAIYAYESGRVLLGREVGERIAAVLTVRLGELLVGDPDFAADSTSHVPVRRVQGVNPTCERLHPLIVDLLRTSRTLVRMLAVPRFELSSPVGFVHAFELLAQDGRRLLQNDDVASASRQASGPIPDAIEQVARSVVELVRHAEMQYARLKSAAEAGSCVDACRVLAGELTERITQLTDAHQQLIERGGLKPGLPDTEPDIRGDLDDLTPWAEASWANVSR